MSSMISPLRTTSSSRKTARASSPSYFGLAVDPSSTVTSSGARNVRPGYGPLSAGIRSSAASPPQTLPFHTPNAELDAFKREADQRSKFSFNPLGIARADEKGELPKQLPPRRISKQESAPPEVSSRLSKGDLASLDNAEPLSRSPKRTLPADSETIFDRPRRDSPASFLPSEGHSSSDDVKMPRLSGGLSQSHEPTRVENMDSRSETLPPRLESAEEPSMITSQHLVNILSSQLDDVLVLDLRVATQHAKSHIIGALNLCVPTTLLKRPTYSVQKLAETFSNEDERTKFGQWRSCRYMIVYDGNSTQLKEAANCHNVLKKFIAEGWTGGSYIVKGGFFDFARKFPQHVEEVGSTTDSVSPGAVAPVIGGCPIPASKTAVNPFFSNIRQNMDLIGGVGQMSLSMPQDISSTQFEHLPAWLRQAADEADNGKAVSNKFLNIEKRELKRMQEALSGNVVYGSPGADSVDKVRVAGLEKGAKNRYNNIWPFEHSRVKLQGVSRDGCDYVNASFLSTSLSRKRYIATQGPIPATFNDFWNMVWQRDVRVIVMLTAEKEGGQIKAHNYWDQRTYGSLKLKLISERRAAVDPAKIWQHRKRPTIARRHTSQVSSRSGDGDVNMSSGTSSPSDEPHVVVRRFTLAHTAEPFAPIREVTQLHYSSWPDFGAPAQPSHVLGLVEQTDLVVRAAAEGSNTGANRPILVHCSAGCGRTGAFCTVDSVVDMLKEQQRHRRHVQQHGGTDAGGDWKARDDLDLVEHTVDELRRQRLSVVQSLRQFVLCYEAVAYYLVAQDGGGKIAGGRTDSGRSVSGSDALSPQKPPARGSVGGES